MLGYEDTAGGAGDDAVVTAYDTNRPKQVLQVKIHLLST